MKLHVLNYSVVADFVERRLAHREEFQRNCRAAANRGELLAAGPLDPVDSVLLVFRTEDVSVVEQFARQDPFVVHGLVTKWEVRPWTIVAGTMAEG